MGALALPNRVVKSAAGFIGVTSRGITGDLHLQHYASLAKGGASVVYCDDFAELYDHFKAVPDVGKFADWTEDELRTFASAIKDNGSRAGYQLATMGLMFSGFEPDPNALFQSSDCMDMTAQEIQDLIADTVKAASTLKACGFDCVEINAAGENIGQTFMSRNRNKRDDEYGPQSFENRTRFVCEVVRGIKATCGDDFPVQVLVNGAEENDKNIGDNALFTTVEENKEMCKLIEEAGADSLHIRIGPCGMHVAEFAGDSVLFAGFGIEGTTGYGTQFDFQRHWQGMLKADQSGLGVMTKVAAEIKKAVSIPVGAVTYMDPARDPEFFERLIADGEIDFILMNRPLSVEPEYLAKLKEGRLDEIRPCTRCMHCHWDADLEGNQVFSCRTNAAHPFRIVSGQLPGLYDPEPAASAKNVMVVGGGPAGMEAARVAAERGHHVTLYERKGSLGGLLEFASNVKGPHENLIPLKTYLAKQLEVAGVNVVTDQEVDASFISEQAPDAVVLAVGCRARHAGALRRRRREHRLHRRLPHRRRGRRRGGGRVERPGHRRRDVPHGAGQARPGGHAQPRKRHRRGPLVLGQDLHATPHQGARHAFLAPGRGGGRERRQRDRQDGCRHGGGAALRHAHRSAGRAAQHRPRAGAFHGCLSRGRLREPLQHRRGHLHRQRRRTDHLRKPLSRSAASADLSGPRRHEGPTPSAGRPPPIQAQPRCQIGGPSLRTPDDPTSPARRFHERRSLLPRSRLLARSRKTLLYPKSFWHPCIPFILT